MLFGPSQLLILMNQELDKAPNIKTEKNLQAFAQTIRGFSQDAAFQFARREHPHDLVCKIQAARRKAIVSIWRLGRALPLSDDIGASIELNRKEIAKHLIDQIKELTEALPA